MRRKIHRGLWSCLRGYEVETRCVAPLTTSVMSCYHRMCRRWVGGGGRDAMQTRAFWSSGPGRGGGSWQVRGMGRQRAAGDVSYMCIDRWVGLGSEWGVEGGAVLADTGGRAAHW